MRRGNPQNSPRVTPKSNHLVSALNSPGVRVCSTSKHSDYVHPNETFAVNTIDRLRREYGERVVSAALETLVKTQQPGVLSQGMITHMVQLIRLFPRWVERKDELAAAVRKMDLAALRSQARLIGGKGAMMALMASELSAELGRGR